MRSSTNEKRLLSNGQIVSNMLPKILIIDNSVGRNGAFESIFKTVDSLSSQFEFHVVLPKNTELKEELESIGCAVLLLDLLEINRGLSTLNYPFRLRKNATILLQYLDLDCYIFECLELLQLK